MRRARARPSACCRASQTTPAWTSSAKAARVRLAERGFPSWLNAGPRPDTTLRPKGACHAISPADAVTGARLVAAGGGVSDGRTGELAVVRSEGVELGISGG